MKDWGNGIRVSNEVYEHNHAVIREAVAGLTLKTGLVFIAVGYDDMQYSDYGYGLQEAKQSLMRGDKVIIDMQGLRGLRGSDLELWHTIQNNVDVRVLDGFGKIDEIRSAIRSLTGSENQTKQTGSQDSRLLDALLTALCGERNKPKMGQTSLILRNFGTIWVDDPDIAKELSERARSVAAQS